MDTISHPAAIVAALLFGAWLLVLLVGLIQFVRGPRRRDDARDDHRDPPAT